MIIKPSLSQVSNSINDLANAFRIVSEMSSISDDNIILDLSDIENISPTFIIPVLLALHEQGDDATLICSDNLKRIMFPMALQTSSLRHVVLKAKLREILNAGSLPICVFPVSKEFEDETSSIISIIETEVFERLSIKHNLRNGLRYIIGEIVDNIIQHSNSDKGYIYILYNKHKNTIEVAIADVGIGLTGSYKESADNDIESDIEAIQAANRGISTKNLPNAENRGFGIITSKRMIIDGLNGLFIMISGQAALIKTKGFNQYLELSEDIKFRGTTIIFSFNLESDNFNYINYVE